MKNCSKSSYTNKWLSRNKRFWYEKECEGVKVIIINKVDAPKIVHERILEINRRRMRFCKNSDICCNHFEDNFEQKKTSVKDV